MSHPTVHDGDTKTIGILYPPPGPASAGPVLVATDGSAAGEAACRAASLIAATSSSIVQVMVVVEPLPVFVPELSGTTQQPVPSPAFISATRDRIAGQLRKIAPEASAWQVDVKYGRPSDEIVNQARDRDAQLIVIGLVHHGMMDRILDGDTAQEVVRQCHVPVLVVSPGWKALPMRAVFAVDFSAQSMQAARAGLRLLKHGSTVVLAHVRQTATVFDGMGMWEEEYDQAATRELGKFAESLNAPAGIHVEQMTLSGSPSGALLRFANRTEADLIVIGTRGLGLIQRALLGSVATRVLRHSTCSLLIVPDLKD